MFYGAFILVALGLSATSSTVLVTAVANWFRRKLGVATGIMDCGVAFGGLLIPLMVILIDLYEWRTTMLILGLGMLAVVLPLALVARHKPEQYGYLPDGELGSSAITEEGLTLAQTAEEGVGAMQALKSGAFWRIALALACFSMMGITLSTHVMPYLNSMGISRVTSGLVASAIPLVSIGGRLSFGWFGDKFDKRWISASAFAMMGLGLLCFEYASTAGVWALVPFLVLFGTGMGGIHPMRATLLRDYFGRSKFGTIFGFATGVMMIGNIAGAPLAGWVFDNWGSYQGVWSALACLAIISIALITTTPRPQSG